MPTWHLKHFAPTRLRAEFDVAFIKADSFQAAEAELTGRLTVNGANPQHHIVLSRVDSHDGIVILHHGENLWKANRGHLAKVSEHRFIVVCGSRSCKKGDLTQAVEALFDYCRKSKGKFRGRRTAK